MKRNFLSRLVLPVALAFGALLFFPMASQAIHKSGVFYCLNCHSMHATTLWTGGTGGSRLLKYNKGAEFCLQCHEETTVGTKVTTGETVPFVAKIGGVPAGKTTTVGAAGYFYGLAALPSSGSPFSSANAHNLDPTAPTIPASTLTITGMFWCTNCHDQHGTGATDLAGVTGSSMLNSGANATYTVDNFRNLKRQTSATDLDVVETAYTNTRYKGGIAPFCAQCHDKADDGPSTGYHPVDLTISTATFAGSNYRTAMDDTLTDTGQPIIKPEDPLGDDNPTAAAAGSRDVALDDQVVCLTCHYAHGGPYSNNLRWRHDGTNMIAGDFSDPNTDTVPALADRASAYGCQVCHNK